MNDFVKTLAKVKLELCGKAILLHPSLKDPRMMVDYSVKSSYWSQQSFELIFDG